MAYKQKGEIASLSGKTLNRVEEFIYLGSNIASTEKDVNIRIGKAWTALTKLTQIWKSNLPDHMKRDFFQATVASVLMYGCTTWTLTKNMEKRLDGNYTRMLRAVLNISWKQHPTKQLLYGPLPPISQTIKERRARFAGHCWRSKAEIISDVLLWAPKHGNSSQGGRRKNYIKQLCDDAECHPDDLPNMMSDRAIWRERVTRIRATSTP